jgi:hypothetical protein
MKLLETHQPIAARARDAALSGSLRLLSITATLAILMVSGGRLMALEKPSYAVLESDGGMELRQYEPYIAAETFVEAGFERAGNEGFRRLADYIFGNNRSRQKLQMTVCARFPLLLSPRSATAAPGVRSVTRPTAQSSSPGSMLEGGHLLGSRSSPVTTRPSNPGSCAVTRS